MPASPPTTVVEEVPPKTTPAHAVSLLINTAVGAGVLSLPYAFSCAGWVGGAVVLAAVACLESFTLYVLSRWAESTGACSYGEMVHRTLGPAASATLSLVIFLYLFGSGVAYLVVLGDCLNPLLVHFFGTVWWSSREVAIALVGCTSILPLCFPDNIGSASGISIVNFVAFLAVVLAIVTRSVLTLAAAETPFEGVEVIAPSLLKAVPIAVFSLQCHAQVVAVFNELEDTAELPLPFSDGEEAGSEAQATMGEENKGLLARFRRKRRPKSHKLTTMTRVIVQASEYTRMRLPDFFCTPWPDRSFCDRPFLKECFSF